MGQLFTFGDLCVLQFIFVLRISQVLKSIRAIGWLRGSTKTAANDMVIQIPLIESVLVRTMYPELDLTEGMTKIIREKCSLDISLESIGEEVL